MVKGQARGRPGAAASLPNPGAAATAASPAASVGAASAKTAYQQYVKGKRREGLEVLKRAHEESPSAATCLLGAKLHVLEAAEAAFKVRPGGPLGAGARLAGRDAHAAALIACCVNVRGGPRAASLRPLGMALAKAWGPRPVANSQTSTLGLC